MFPCLRLDNTDYLDFLLVRVLFFVLRIFVFEKLAISWEPRKRKNEKKRKIVKSFIETIRPVVKTHDDDPRNIKNEENTSISMLLKCNI